MPVYGLPNAVAHTAPDVVTNANANGCADTGANVGTDVESDKRAKLVADAKPHARADTDAVASANTSSDATRTSGLCDERLRQVDTVLEDVRRRNAVTNEIHRGGAGARRQGVRQLSPGAGLQPGGVHVRRAKLQRFRAIWRVFGVVRQQRRQAPHAHIAGQAVHGCDAI